MDQFAPGILKAPPGAQITKFGVNWQQVGGKDIMQFVELDQKRPLAAVIQVLPSDYHGVCIVSYSSF